MVNDTAQTSETADALARPDHVEEIIRVTAKLRADHHRTATRLQRAVSRMVDLLGRPAFVGLLIAAVSCWAALNFLAPTFGYVAADPPPFQWLELIVSLAALCVTILILTTQRRDDQLAQLREEMTLDLAILAEQKLAKVIQLLEESRRDNPLLDDRVDAAAEAMSSPADMHSLRDAAQRSNQLMRDRFQR